MLTIRKNILVFIVTISALTTSNTLIAADFTFNVPVKFTNLHQLISKVEVTCSVLSASNNSLGTISKSKQVINGNVDQTVTVGINSAGKSFVKKWKCETKVCQNFTCNFLSTGTNDTRFKSAAGTSNVKVRSGSL